MEFKVKAIALRSVDYKDNDKMLTLFSVENGIISAGIRGVKKQGSKLRFCCEPFCFAEYVINNSNGRNTVISATEIESFYNIRNNVNNYYAGCCVLEFLLKTLSEGVKDEGLFLLTVNAVKSLTYNQVNAKQVVIAYILKALVYLGYQGKFDACGRCGKQLENRTFFNFNHAYCVCERCNTTEDMEIMFETMQTLKKCFYYDLEVKLFIEEKFLVRALKFVNYYLSVKMGINLKTITQLLEL